MKKLIFVFMFIIMIASASAIDWTITTNFTHNASGADRQIRTTQQGVYITMLQDADLVGVGGLVFGSGPTTPYFYVSNGTGYTAWANLSLNTTTNFAENTSLIRLFKGVNYTIFAYNGGSNYYSTWTGPSTLPQSNAAFIWANGSSSGSLADFPFNIKTLSLVNTSTSTITYVTFNQTYPSDGFVSTSKNLTVNLSATPFYGNLSNITINAYYGNNSLLNKTTKALVGNVTNTTGFTLLNMPLGHYYIFYNACTKNNSGFVNCSHYSQNYTFIVGASVDSIYYKTNLLETDNSIFKINITLTAGASLTTAKLIYDNVNYTISNISINGTSASLTHFLDAPLVTALTQNKSFRFAFTYTNSVLSEQQTQTYNQTVARFNFNVCNATTNMSVINFSVIDENTGALKLSSFEADFLYWVGSGTIKKNYSYSNTSKTLNTFNFCYSNNSTMMFLDSDIDYSAELYEPRSYYTRAAPLNNTITYVNITLLNATLATKFYLTVVKGVEDMSNALVYVSKKDVGTGQYSLISIQLTDNNAQFVEYLEADKDYQIYVIRSGVNEGNTQFRALCAAAPCEKTIRLSTDDSDLFSGYYGLFASNVMYTHYYDPINETVYLSYADSTGLANYVRLVVLESTMNDTKNYICDTSLFSVSGSISCNMSGYDGSFISYIYISRSPEKLIDYITFVKTVVHVALGKTAFLLAFVLLIAVMLAFAADMRAGLLAVPFALLICNYIGLLAIPYTSIGGLLLLVLVIATVMGRGQ